ncbi:MAG: aminotransferase class III-fold pyridoxal phosphate-dependent enzyme [Deltaproteobacteria bacterium]|nr:aminotransferase class III-fold pyridoxal phosphate-dependent enzyme [Deltaproteobacteria bacterium]
MSDQYAITEWPDTVEINNKLQDLIKMPMYQIRRDKMADYLRTLDSKCKKSKAIHEEAVDFIPGGAQHNIAFNYPFPIAIERAEGPYMWDVDGNRYNDFAQAGGPVVLGHNYPMINEKVIEFLKTCSPGTGMFHEYELKLAKLINHHMPSVEMFRMLGSGTEAVMGAIRLARAYTGKAKIIKFGGGYHGWGDQMAYSLHIPQSKLMKAAGIPEEVFTHIQEVYPNDIDELRETMSKNEAQGGTAAFILEPLGPESATRPIDIDYVREARKLCDQYGALLIFDEVVTGFRIGLGGVQGYFDIYPDVTVFGKCLTGGYPAAGGVGGKREIMSCFGTTHTEEDKPKVFVGGTLAANPMSCVAGYYAIKEMEATNALQRAGKAADRLAAGLKHIMEKYNLPFIVYNLGSICSLQTSAVQQTDINNPKQRGEAQARKKIMEEIGAAFTAEGIISIAGCKMYTNAMQTDDVIDEALEAFDRVFSTIEQV